MRQILKNFFSSYRNILLYGFIGSVGAMSDVIFFMTLIEIFGESLFVIFNILSYSLGTTISYFLNYKINFKIKKKLGKRFLIFFLVAFIGLSISSVFVYFFLSVLSFRPIVGKTLSLFVVFIFQYFVNSRFTFNANRF